MSQGYSEIEESSFDAEELLNPRVRTSTPPPPPEEGTQQGYAPSPGGVPYQQSGYTAPVRPQPQPVYTQPQPQAAYTAPVQPQPQPAYTAPVQPQPANTAPAQSAASEGQDKESELLITESTLAKLRMFAGILLFFLAAYTLIVTVSYFSNLSHDQSALLGGDYDPSLYSNAGRVIGARMSHFLLYEWLGVGVFIFIYYVGALALRLLNVVKFKFWNFTFKCLLSAVAISIIGGFLVELLDAHTRFYWGGLHGYLVNHELTAIAGIWGALALSAVMAGLLVVLFIDSLSKIIRWMGAGIERLRERRRREQEEFNARRREAERVRAEQEAERLRVEQERLAAEQARVAAMKATQLPVQPIVPAEAPVSAPVEAEREEETGKEEVEPAAVPADEPLFAPVEKNDNKAAEEDEPLFAFSQVTASPAAEAPGVKPPLSYEVPLDDEYVDDDEPEEQLPLDMTDEEYFEDEYDEKGDLEEYQDDEMTVDVPVVEPAVAEAVSELQQPSELQSKSSFYDPRAELSRFEFPSLSLLREVAYSTDSVDATEMEENKNRITKTLGDYGIPISHIHATVGPTVTLYEIIPAEGVRIAKIKRLEDDIAMSLAALGIRIIAPIPGKGTIGIEVPNKDPQVVSIHTILSSRKFQESKMELPMALGCTISNDVFMADLAKMPHLLVAGATGMGKSVGLNTIIASLLYKKHPTELKFVLIDPKMVEFSLYAGLEKHYLAKLPDEEDAIITDPLKVVATLNSLCIEMDNRYALLKTASCRNIKEYNERIMHGNLMARHEQGHRFLPYIVVIVDEFADLIMTAGKEVETPIARIAQKARAVGIHMILATQRPSTNVITGVIKANFPGRIAFRVFQMVDSRTILDRPGANQLIGRGDMLFSNNGKIERVQCAFIDTPEVEAICEAIGKQAGLDTYPLPEYVPETDGSAGISGNPSDRDPLFGDAARYVVQTDTASTSSLQRRYSIGYNRAGKIMDQLEAAGIVGPAQGGKPRQVLLDTIQVARMLGDE